MTTGQLARATGTPERTVRYRLDQLHEANLVECVRPGRESGSAPQHWWLRPAGARLVTGTAMAEGRPSAMFVGHAAAISEVWLAMVEHGRGVGIEPGSWLTDRAGWQEWDGGTYWTRRSRLTPDAVVAFTVAGLGPAVAFIEVDLASMTQTTLRQKVVRYLDYAAARAWEGVFPHCPPMLLLTTTATRAATFVRAASRLLAEQRFDVEDPGVALVVAACGHVREPARAVVEPSWLLPDTTTEVTLAEILTERLGAQIASDAWQHHHTTVVQRRADLDELSSLRTEVGLGDSLGSARAAAVLRVLVGADPSGFLDAEPDFAARVLGWVRLRRRVGKFEAREQARPIVSRLEERHAAVWTEQARRLLTAQAHLAAGHPLVYKLAATLAEGDLADDMAVLDAPATRTREELQAEALGDYPARRAASVEEAWQALRRRDRRRTSRQDLADQFDGEHLLICAGCTMVYPLPETYFYRCRYCGDTLLDWADRTTVTSLAQRLEAIRRRLADLLKLTEHPTIPAAARRPTESDHWR